MRCVCAYMPQQMLLPSNASCAVDGFGINENFAFLSASAHAAAGGGGSGKEEYISKTLNALTGDIESSNKLWCSASDTLLSRDFFFSSALRQTNFCAFLRQRSNSKWDGGGEARTLGRRHFCTQATQTCGVRVYATSKRANSVLVIHNNGRSAQSANAPRATTLSQSPERVSLALCSY